MKRVAVVLGIVVAMLAAVAFGAAWYYSNLIIDGAAVKGYDTDYGITVDAVDASGAAGTVTYTVPESMGDPTQDAETTSITGLWTFDGAYLQLQQGAAVDGRTITRPFVLLRGPLPSPGAAARYDWDSYPSPESLGAVSSDVTYDAPGGPTPAVRVEPAGAPNGSWVIVVHGRNASVREGYRALPLYAERGFTTLFINYRDDTKEGGAPAEDGIGNFGLTEWPDLEAAVQYAAGNGAQHVILVGWSMGGSIVASYLEHASNTGFVVATQLDSPAVSLTDTVLHGARQKGIPTGPLAPVVWLAQRITEVRVDLDFEASEYKDNAAAWPVPALVTAGSEDATVPPDSIEEFAAAVPNRQFTMFDGAAHTGEWNWESEPYDELVGSWLDNVVLPLTQG